METPETVRKTSLFILALVFTVGLTFASVELPYIIDDFLQNSVNTPDIDSQVSDASRFTTELFISHFNIRLIGYVCFGLTIILIIAGFATRETGYATAGAVVFMLPVFAQFAGVMFFLAGLGLLNTLWLPVLDISFAIQELGRIIRAPFDLIIWLFRLVGVSAYWPLVYLTIGGGLLTFLLGTYTWLTAKSQGKDVADFWVYRISRHPQYLGWIIWTYGLYLLLLQERYPKRSWGIDASLPWLLSTMILVGVAMMEELTMADKKGESYGTYRQKAPFLFPAPRVIGKIVSAPFRIFFKSDLPRRRHEIVLVLSLYTVILIGASAFFYGSGLDRTIGAISPSGVTEDRIEELVAKIDETTNNRERFFLANRLGEFGAATLPAFLMMLEHSNPDVRVNATEQLGNLRSPESVPALIEALGDSVVDVRVRALSALVKIGATDAAPSMVPLLRDPDGWVQSTALQSLAMLGSEDAIDPAMENLHDSDFRARINAMDALGALKAERAVPAIVKQLDDENPDIRRAAVVALAQIGSPKALPALERACDDEDWEVRVYAAEAVERIK